jgi:hypothetical protein
MLLLTRGKQRASRLGVTARRRGAQNCPSEPGNARGFRRFQEIFVNFGDIGDRVGRIDNLA